jgi:hypothetical protein
MVDLLNLKAHLSYNPLLRCSHDGIYRSPYLTEVFPPLRRGQRLHLKTICVIRISFHTNTAVRGQSVLYVM